MKRGVKLFTDRDYTLTEALDFLMGRPFLRTSIEGYEIECTKPGEVFVMTLSKPHYANQGAALHRQGFTKVDAPEFQLFPGEINRVFAWRKELTKGDHLRFRKLALLVLGDGTGVVEIKPEPPKPWSENAGEKLYNGIVLPEIWPPRHLDPNSDEPMPVPYLHDPPPVVPIDVGRQLFVDDFLIESTTLTRTFHQARKYEGNPVFKAETPRELAASTEGERGEEATTFLGQGGVFYDPAKKHFQMFYVAGWRGPLALATSTDMIHWKRPDLGLAGGNSLLPEGLSWTGPQLKSGGSDNCAWLDLNAANPADRIKFMTCWVHVPQTQQPQGFTHSLHVSDGRRWSEATPTGMAGDYCSFFYNPFRGKWCYSIKQGRTRGRCRYYWEHVDFLKGADWSKSVYWTNADRLDAPEPEGRYPGAGDKPQLYSLNAVAYESLMVGMHYIHRGPDNRVCAEGKFPKLIDLELGFSRDGFHWDRPDRRGFIVGSRIEGAWDRAYLHSTAGVFVVLDDQLIFPYTGTSGIAPSGHRGMYTGGAIGIATLRRDGFASMDAEDKPGTLTTRPVLFSGKHLFANLDAPSGGLRVEVLDAAGKVLATSHPAKGDQTKLRIAWADRPDLAEFAPRPVRFRFHLTNGHLYAFWVTPDAGGASDGYLAAGGPGFSGTRDTAGGKQP
ncbi:MAG: glycosyl hydrolase family 32 [Planctomycetota bacterium]|nr:glycosyl hydrolase family 32 [Planctomycetota bacterium]